MQMTLRQAMEHQAALAALAGLTFPAKLSFAIKRNVDALSRETDRVEQQRIELCRRYADKDEDGDPVMTDAVVNGRMTLEYQMDDATRAEFAKEYAELLDTTVDVGIQRVGEDVLERCDADTRYSVPTVAQLAGMDFMIGDGVNGDS